MSKLFQNLHFVGDKIKRAKNVYFLPPDMHITKG